MCSYPQHKLVPLTEGEPWNGYPGEANAPYGIAKKALLVMMQAYHEQCGLDGAFLLPISLTIRELTELVARLMGFEGDLVWNTPKPDGHPRRCLDTPRPRERFGFEVSKPLEEGLERTITWFRAHGCGWIRPIEVLACEPR